MKRLLDIALYVIADVLLSIFSIWLALMLRFDGAIVPEYAVFIPLYLSLCAAFAACFGLLCGCYNGVWIFFGFSEMFRQMIAVCLSGVALLVLKYAQWLYIPGSAVVIYCGVLFIFTTSVRGMPRLYRWVRVMMGAQKGENKRVVIVGAGAAGAMVIKRLRAAPQDGYYPVAAVDDDPQKEGLFVAGVRVFGPINKVAETVSRYKAQGIIIAMPSADADTLRRVFDDCKKTGLPVKFFQSMVDMERFLAGNKMALRDVSIEDLLFRDEISPDMHKTMEYLSGKIVLVTGGCGSIGSEICRQVLRYGCRKLVIFDIHENGMFDLNEELKRDFPDSEYETYIGSVRDISRLNWVFSRERPQVVFHAAAHKHVPMMERNPAEAVKNNVYGTRNVAEACMRYGTSKLILVSTDKAVNPSSIMGATKRLAELTVQSKSAPGCEMAAVRFGNVLGSNGSVIPIFRRQIAEGGPVTVTDRNIKRYFMTIPEAVSLVLSAGAMARGGEIFVLDMGKPVLIYDLACDLIRMSGLEPNKDVAVKITGLRPGEKMFEELSLDSEKMDKTSHKKIFVVKSDAPDRRWIEEQLAALAEILMQEDEEQVREQVFRMITEGTQHKINNVLYYPSAAETAGSR